MLTFLLDILPSGCIPFIYFILLLFFVFFKRSMEIMCLHIRDVYCVVILAQADLLMDLAVPHGDDSSSALTTSNGSVMDNYRQAQLAAWRELRASVDRGTS